MGGVGIASAISKGCGKPGVGDGREAFCSSAPSCKPGRGGLEFL